MMKNILATSLTLAMLSFNTNVSATPALSLDALKKEIAKCAAKTGDLTKLDCYARLAKNNDLVTTTTSLNNLPDKGKWRVTEKTNPVDDSKTVVLLLDATSGKGTYGDEVYVVIRCQSDQTELYLSWNSYLGLDTAYILTRIGNEKASTKSWSISTNNKSSFYPGNDIAFLKKMMTSNKFIAQVTPYSESPITAIFDTTGLESAIKPLRDVCSW